MESTPRGLPLLAGLAVGLVASVLASCSFSARVGRAAPPTSTTLTSVPTKVDLRAVALHDYDFGSGWTTVDDQPLSTADATHGPCGSQLWQATTRAYGAEFTYQLQSSGIEHGHAADSVFEAPDAGVVAAQRAFIESQPYRDCALHNFQDDIISSMPRNVTGTIDDGHVDVISPASGDAAAAYRLTVHYHAVSSTSGRGDLTATAESFHFYKGRYTGVVFVSWCTCAPFPTDTGTRVAGSMRSHIAALSG